ncbi:RNA-binding protein [Bacillus sp. AFS040349]|uniref:RNA-binding protein n=1 Tax=Bacillus sp. AFS040349 TaxID=2033502 RepID=UPI000BFB8FD1|nr:RNA-binding protein [Bacillus sp. AFS040349]PGT82219.1 RNA-binding protein [Bacillus sp. AFS040349]
MTETFTPSWTNDSELEVLARASRNRDIVKGAVRSVSFKKSRVLEGDTYVTKEMEVVTFLLEGGITAYCPAPEFSDREYRSLIGFVGSIQEFIIDRIDLEDKIAVVSVKKADEIKKARFWDELEYLEKKGELNNQIYQGTVAGYDQTTQSVYVRVNGADCIMYKSDWDHGRIGFIGNHAERGASVGVKIVKFDREKNRIQVSRKATLKDPFDLLDELKDAEAIVGKVSGVDPIHGIFVTLDNGIEVKGMKPAKLEEPIVGDIVTCKIRQINKEKRRCKVVIIGYPRGKKKRNDLGSFLFD